MICDLPVMDQIFLRGRRGRAGASPRVCFAVRAAKVLWLSSGMRFTALLLTLAGMSGVAAAADEYQFIKQIPIVGDGGWDYLGD